MADMSDIVSSVLSIAPVAAPGRVSAFVQPGSGSAGEQGPNQDRDVKKPSISVPNSTDVVSLQSLQAEDTLQTGPGKAPTASVAQAQAQAQAALYAAKAAAQAQQSEAAAKAQQSEAQQKAQDNQQGSTQQAVGTLSSYFSNIHPDVSFRVEQQAGREVVLMVNSTDGKVLQTISGDEARILASSLFGKSAPAAQKA
jgi:uncharacterized FlaG/YvyC family protein